MNLQIHKNNNEVEECTAHKIIISNSGCDIIITEEDNMLIVNKIVDEFTHDGYPGMIVCPTSSTSISIE